MPGGRPSRYKKEYVEQAYNLCLLGATDERLAEIFHVKNTTIDNWKKKHPEFLGALKAGRDEADAIVSKSLYHRAKGYVGKEFRVVMVGGQPKTIEIEKHYPPDPTSIIFWLKNRQREKWRDRVEAEFNHKGKVDTNIQFVPAKLD